MAGCGRTGSDTPLYCFRCKTCETEREEIQSISAPSPECCGAPMVKVPAGASFAFRTQGGNLYGFSPSHGRVTKGNRRPVTISRGNGLGGKRPPPKLVDLGNGQVGVAKR